MQNGHVQAHSWSNLTCCLPCFLRFPIGCCLQAPIVVLMPCLCTSAANPQKRRHEQTTYYTTSNTNFQQGQNTYFEERIPQTLPKSACHLVLDKKQRTVNTLGKKQHHALQQPHFLMIIAEDCSLHACEYGHPNRLHVKGTSLGPLSTLLCVNHTAFVYATAMYSLTPKGNMNLSSMPMGTARLLNQGSSRVLMSPFLLSWAHELYVACTWFLHKQASSQNAC